MARGDKLESIRGTPLFEPDWYRQRYPEVAGGDPAAHFLAHGASGNYDPGPRFSARYYLQTHAGARRRGANPLLHHLNHPHPRGLDRGAVLKAADDLMQAGQAPLALKLARRDLAASARHAVEILHCNALVHKPGRWMRHLNAYLAALGQDPLQLRRGATAFARLAARDVPAVTGGPKITVIMAAWNARDTIGRSIRSILGQSWRNLELIVVDDASTDTTPALLARIAAEDDRLHVLRNAVNVGPYVSRNIALKRASGQWITCHDTDEWAHPQRLALHMDRVAGEGGAALPVSTLSMLRMTVEGRFSQIRPVGREVFDGVLQVCAPSTLFHHQLLRERLGSWDCARFGADKEMMGRVAAALGRAAPAFPVCANLSLDWAGSLTNNPVTGIHPDHGVTPARAAYRESWRGWQAARMPDEGVFVPFPPRKSRFSRPPEAEVPLNDILANLASPDGV
ncbi:glycosyltransferase family 2 protein [Oceaniglobus trochenteri]|uniref:glycosyltransferase family 2 protein n=1 Tax=Oceaniglobus trochenteri TaxID=2763260 RepID=UPI001D000CC8|nr:glycosyltransferase family 2 protein [Oceaniglobus trochenteri]